jgi:acyl-CoA synthetase (AMP-forming)/AMP-acid ligase II
MSRPRHLPASIRLTDVVTTPEREAALVAAGWWEDATLVERVCRRAREAPSAIAVVDDAHDRRVTYAELERDARRVAAQLGGVGVEVGDVVTLQLPNWYSAVAVAVGALMAGAVVNPVLPAYRERELLYMLETAGAKVVVTPREYRGFDHAAMIDDLRTSLPDLRAHLVLGPDRASFDGMFAAPPASRLAEVAPGWVCELMFTSGTEAEPKAVMHTEWTLSANSGATALALGLGPTDPVWMPAPIAHSTGFNHGMRLALQLGSTLVLQDRWDPVEGARMVAAEACTHTLLATTFLRDLVRARRDGAADVSSLRAFGCGGAPIPPAAVEDAAEAGIVCLRLYGATESLVATWNRPESPAPKRLNTDGLPLDGVELEVRDADGHPVVGAPGEIHTRSHSTCVGFFDDDARTSATFDADGFVRSGDLGVLDDDGYLTVVGRKKEIIIRGGLNIAPAEVELLLLGMPAVRQAAVIGVPHERLGERTCACVVLEDGATTTLEDVVRHLRGAGLATYKLPEVLAVREELPTTATGKVRKHELVAEIAAAQTRA